MSSISSIDLIESSICIAQERVVILTRGPMYIWTSGELPTHCDWCGAVQIAQNKAQRSFPSGWFKEFLDLIGKDPIWFYKFNFGFTHIRSLDVISSDKSGKDVYSEDKVSRSAADLAKRHGFALK